MEQSKQRQAAIRELVETERQYLTDLQLVDRVYIQPMSRLRYFPGSTRDRIFGNIEQIRDISFRVLILLEESAAQDGSNIAAALLPIIPFFKTYTEYVNNYEFSAKTLAIVQKGSKARSFLKKAENSPGCRGNDLESLLIGPIQRLPRYILLLEKILKFTPKEHPDRFNLEMCLSSIRLITDEVDDAAMDSQNWLEILALQKRFNQSRKTGLASFGRRLLHAGKLTKQGRRKEIEYTFFLFNDILSYAHGSGTTMSKYVLHRNITINCVFEVRDIPNTGETFKLEILNDDKSFIVAAATLELKTAWQQYLKEAICEAKKSPEYASCEFPQKPSWVPDEASNLCEVCGDEFTFLNRRHHCRKCGSLVCNMCSRHRLSLGTKDEELIRVCDSCFLPSTETLLNKSAMGFIPSDSLENISNASTIASSVASTRVSDLSTASSFEMSHAAVNQATRDVLGNEETNILGMSAGDTTRVIYRDRSGYWYCVNEYTGGSGWVDPGVFNQNCLYRPIVTTRYNSDTFEIGLTQEDTYELIQKDESGYWWIKNTRTSAEGWVDPDMLERVDELGVNSQNGVI